MLLDKLPIEKKLKLIGEVAILMMDSSIHKHYRVGDISNVIIPALHLNQFRIYRIGHQPVGFVSWAYLSDEIEKKYTSSPMLLELLDWRSGNNLFFIDFIAPFGHARKIIQDLKINIFPDKIVAKALRFKQVGKLQKVATYYGKNVSRKNLLNNQEINFGLTNSK